MYNTAAKDSFNLHKPVLLKEVLDFLRLKDGMVVLDGTVGTGAHAFEIMKRIQPTGKIICVDRDKESLELAKSKLKEFGDSCMFAHDNFCNIYKILDSLKINKVDGVLLDLGISSFQLDNPDRGFSFLGEGPLDMRMNRDSSLSAFDLVNNLRQEELASILWQMGEERFSRRIAQMVIRCRKEASISTTAQLAQLVKEALPHRFFYRVHPATLTFQALRIAVNQELESLEIFLNKADKFINKSGRICVIAFHSLEDRIVKRKFRSMALDNKEFKLVVKKPVIASLDEIKNNPRSRSAKLRVIERI